MNSRNDTPRPLRPALAAHPQDLRAAAQRAFELRARHAYELHGLAWHDQVIWLGSPLAVDMTVILSAALGRDTDLQSSGPDLRALLRFRVFPDLKGTATEDLIDSVAAALERLRQAPMRPERGGPLYPRFRNGMLPEEEEAHILRAAEPVLTRCLKPQHRLGLLHWERSVSMVLPAGTFSPFDLTDNQVGRQGGEVLDSCRWWYANQDFLLISAQPRQVHRESLAPGPAQMSRPRLHCLEAPAITWPDGWGVAVVHGMRVPDWIIREPESITVAVIEQETNAELRRVLIERYGWHRYISDCGAEVIDSVPMDHEITGLRGARLLRKELRGEPEPIVYLEMVNSSPEPDGSYRRYLTRVDPGSYGGAAGRQCHAAMASLWRFRDAAGVLQRTFPSWEDYRPQGES